MKICIESQDDGTYLVGEDAPMGEGAEMGEGMPQEMVQDQAQGMKPAASLDEALEMARGLLGSSNSGGMSVEQAFQGGFNGEHA